MQPVSWCVLDWRIADPARVIPQEIVVPYGNRPAHQELSMNKTDMMPVWFRQLNGALGVPIERIALEASDKVEVGLDVGLGCGGVRGDAEDVQGLLGRMRLGGGLAGTHGGLCRTSEGVQGGEVVSRRTRNAGDTRRRTSESRMCRSSGCDRVNFGVGSSLRVVLRIGG